MLKNTTLLVIILALACQDIFSQNIIWNETPEQRKQRMQWWTHDRFGMFIHWGIYALPARHEWVKQRERLTNEDYQKYFDNFNPDLYDPAEWARIAKEAGMKYVVLTAKHHDGFCLFKSEYTDYHAGNTPYGKDLIKEYVDAFRAEGMGVGFYYSLIDWHHPHFTIDAVHPLRTTSREEYDRLNRGKDMAVYREYMKNQVHELLTNYGKIDIIWLDFSYPGEFGKGHQEWGSVELLKMVRQLQPHILVNNRLDLMEYRDGWDFVTPEQFKVQSWPELGGEKIPWETCQTFSGSWGYYRDEYTWKDNKQLLVLLIESVSKGGNVLLNVGPTARGTIDYRAQSALEKMGEWMKYNNRSIYGCTQAPEEFEVPEHSLLTYNPETNRLYVHLIDYPMTNFLLPGMKGRVRYVQFLHDASEILITEPYGHQRVGDIATEADLNLRLPVNKPNVEIPVIELFLYD
jgi:alpha-L-fucosidase